MAYHEQWECETHQSCRNCHDTNTRDILGMPKHIPSVDVGFCEEECEFVRPGEKACCDWEER